MAQRVLHYQNQSFELECSINSENKTCTITMGDTEFKSVQMQKLRHGHMFIYENKVYTLYLIKQNADNIELDINGNSMTCSLYNPKEQSGNKAANKQKDEAQLLSDMPGRVVKILVQEGQTVDAGSPLLVLEAMKMENELRSTGQVIIDKITVKEGDSIESGQTLIEFKKAS